MFRARFYGMTTQLAAGATLCAAFFLMAAKKSEVKLADAFEHKVEQVQENARRENPSTKPTTFTEDEINAYFAQRRLTMPEGVKSVRFELSPETVTAYTTVDFEQLRESRDLNPLLMIFDGVHDCEVIAHAVGKGGLAHVRVDSVKINGLPVPRRALELFIRKYVNPKFPEVALESDYKLAARIDSVDVQQDKGVIVQR